MPLVRYNALSVLRNINLADSDELNDTMHSIARCLDTAPGSEAKRIAENALSLLNKGPILRIVRAIEHNPDYPLLRMAVERLLECRDRTRLEILGAVSELEHLAEEKVLINPMLYTKEYVEALEEFMELPPLLFGKNLTRNKRPTPQEIWHATPTPESSSSDDQATSSTVEQCRSIELAIKSSGKNSQSDKSTNSSSSTPDIVKPAPARKPLPDLPNSKAARLEAKPSTPRRKRAIPSSVPLSEELAVSSSPPTSPPITPSKRSKATKACDECRRRKIKCLRDELDEKCTSCTKMGRDCVLSSPSPIKSFGRGSVKRATPEDLLKSPTKGQAPAMKSKRAMKNILHHFGDLKEGKALGIVSDADDEDSSESVDGVAEMMEVSKVISTMSDPEDFDYNPNKRVCRPGKNGRARSIRKASAIVVE
ncbi:hypothetical protein BKA65DRAFT_470914 [Rhexocercosporidium sp. MPI-PUGE-AT-0058]|nr:hypothetical protein BKA65DRAFT_470914 [Rhexocercosporidium sp. MPI-PUGE-AT-0058]